MKLYTKTGNKGTTIINGKTIEKDSCVVKTLGAFDALMSSINKVIYGLDILPGMTKHRRYCMNIQTELKYLAAEVAGIKVGMFKKADVTFIEGCINSLDIKLDNFVRFSNPIAMDIDEARVRTRNVEREIIQLLRERVISDDGYTYINRLSDYFFTLAVYVDVKFE